MSYENSRYETVIGLETHVELSTKTKIFCGCATRFGGDPNTHCCEICTGMPGSLPRLNKAVIEYAVKAGSALNCDIAYYSEMARKHYVYPDLPKAFQTSQFDKPLCAGGGMDLSNGRRINLTRIHIEEDAGKLVHHGSEVRVDYNRGGVPLIEIVTEPDFRAKEEVLEYLERLQTTLRAIGVSDCRMQEGSLRCDVNLSLRPYGAAEYGVRSETKNLNSFTSIAAAIEHEIERQTEILDSGGIVEQETRSYDDLTGETRTLRSKENADDYRYFPEPDIVPVTLTDAEIAALRASLPELPHIKCARYINDLGLQENDAKLLTKYKAVSDYFEAASRDTDPKSAASFILTNIFASVTTEAEREHFSPSITAEKLSKLLAAVSDGKISKGVAKRLYTEAAESGADIETLLAGETAQSVTFDIAALCRAAIEANTKAAQDYKAGKEKAIKALVGFVMRETKGRADAVIVENELIAHILGR